MRIFCSGIGGIGLSAFAALQHANGHTVFGSDRSDSALLDDLRSQGITVSLQQDGSALPENLDLFVYSEAIPEHAPERVRAKEMGIEQMSYFQALGMISKTHTVIAVCGTHGKSSTVAMAARVLLDAGLDPTIVVGTKLHELNGRNWRKGGSNLFLVEACEYRRSFLHLSPDVILMTNVDGDHFDAFSSLEEYQNAFREFLQLLPPDGVVITHESDPDCRAVVSHFHGTVLNADGLALVSLKTPGRHMQENAQLVLGLAEHLGLDHKKTLQALSGYAGSWRRMEYKGTRTNDVMVVDDYGHHPREIRAVLSALKEAHRGRRLVCAYQPHTHNRTLKLYDEFVSAFSDADVVVVADVYDARSDTETAEVNLKQFIEDIAHHSSTEAVYGGSIDRMFTLLTDTLLTSGDLVLTLGAGTITQLSDKLVA